VLLADLGTAPLPLTPYRVVANPPFGRTARSFTASFNPRPSVDAGIFTITRRDRPALPPDDFERYQAHVSAGFAARADAPQRAVRVWVEEFRTGR
jgi:hypothetical protein